MLTHIICNVTYESDSKRFQTQNCLTCSLPFTSFVLSVVVFPVFLLYTFNPNLKEFVTTESLLLRLLLLLLAVASGVDSTQIDKATFHHSQWATAAGSSDTRAVNRHTCNASVRTDSPDGWCRRVRGWTSLML